MAALAVNRALSALLGALLLIPFSLAVAAAAPTLKNPDKPKSYYATRLGTTLVFDVGDGEQQIQEVTAVEEKDGETLVVMSIVTAGEKSPLEKVSVTAKGVFLLEVGKYKLDPVCKLKFPAKETTTWDIHFAAQPGLLGQSATSTVVGTELVEVPAGKFNAVRVEMVVTAHNGVRLDEPLKYTQWFDPEVGLVKMTGKDGLSRVLKSVTLPDKKDR